MLFRSLAGATEVRVEELRDGLEQVAQSGPVTVVAVGSTARPMRALTAQIGGEISVRRTGNAPSEPHTRFGDGGNCTVVVERTSDKSRYDVASYGPCGADVIGPGWTDVGSVQHPASGLDAIGLADPALEDPVRLLFGVD